MSDMIPPGITRKEPSKEDVFQDFLQEQKEYLSQIGANTKLTEEYLREIAPELQRQTESMQEELDQSNQSKKMFDGFMQSMNQFRETSIQTMKISATNFSNSLFDNFQTPFSLITQPLQELTGFSVKDTFKSGFTSMGASLSSFFSGDEKKERVKPTRSDLLRQGAEGASAVYLADALTDTITETSADEGGGLLSNMLASAGIRGGMSGLTGMLAKVGTFAGIAAPALAGIGAFAALKWDDITDSFSMFQDGQIGRGIETLLLGNREDITEDNAAAGVGRQAAAYGAGVLGVGTTIAAGGALAGGAGLGAALTTGLAAAFPPALIVAGVAAVAKGVQTAWVLEWDKRAEESAEQARSVFADEESNWWDKTKAGVGYAGKAIFGSLAGGIRNVVEESSLGEIWQDEQASFLEKIGRSSLDIMQAPRRFLEGTLETAGEYIWNILPEGVQEGLIGMAEGAQEKLSGVREALFGENSRTAKELFNDFKGNIVGFMGGIKDGIGNFFDDVRERGFRRAAGDALRNAGQKAGQFFAGVGNNISEFFDDVKEQGLAGTMEERINNAIGEADGFFADVGRSIANFFGDVQEEGFGAAVGERAQALVVGIQDFFRNAGERIGSFFSDAWDAVRGVDEAGETRTDRSLRRDSIVSQLGGGNFGGIGDSEAFNQEVERYAAENDLNFGQARRQLQRDDDALLEIAERLGLDSSIPESNIADAFDVMSVNDAIVRPDGQIIRTHPEDTIVATKNNPQVVESGIDREVSREMRSSMGVGSIDYTNKFDTMIDYLSQLIETTARSGGNIITTPNNPQFNFSKLRLGENR